MLGQIEGAPSPGNPTDHALVPSKAACNVVRMSTCRWPGPAQRRACESTCRGKRPARASGSCVSTWTLARALGADSAPG